MADCTEKEVSLNDPDFIIGWIRAELACIEYRPAVLRMMSIRELDRCLEKIDTLVSMHRQHIKSLLAHVELLTSSNATKEKIIAALRGLPAAPDTRPRWVRMIDAAQREYHR